MMYIRKGNCSQAKKRNKRVLYFVQQVCFLLSMEGTLVISRAYKALVGPPVKRPVLAPLAVYSSTTVYIFQNGVASTTYLENKAQSFQLLFNVCPPHGQVQVHLWLVRQRSQGVADGHNQRFDLVTNYNFQKLIFSAEKCHLRSEKNVNSQNK